MKRNDLFFATVLCKEPAKDFFKSICTLAKLKERGLAKTKEYTDAFEKAKEKLTILSNKYHDEVQRNLKMSGHDIQALVDGMDIAVPA